MSRIVKVKLFRGPLDGFVYGLEEVDGKLPNMITLAVPSPVPNFALSEDGPYSENTEPQIVTYRKTHTHPSHGLLPVYRLA